MNRYSKRIALLLLCFVYGGTLAQDNPMQEGIAAFNNENYEQALVLFRQARNQGNTSAALDYNMAVTLFRLGQLDEARAIFLTLPDEPRWSALVKYNLGLIAESEGNQEAARNYFEQAEAQDDEPKISTASSRKLAAIEEQDRVSRPQDLTPPVSLISLTAGTDSNASSLSDEFVQSESQQEDVFSELLAYTQHYVLGRRREGLKAYGLIFNRQFNDFDNLNSLVAGGGLTWEQPLLGYDTETDLRLTHTRLDGDTVADQARLKLGVSEQTDIGLLKSAYSFSYFSAGSRFEQIDGTQHRLEVSWQKGIAPLTLGLRYRYEANDRDNLSRPNGAFSSYSPDRNQLLAEIDWRITDQWSTGLSYEYSDDTYDGINVLRDNDGQVKRQRRERRIDRFRFDVDYRLTRQWLFHARVERADVDDVFDLYTYDKTRVSGAVEYRFQ